MSENNHNYKIGDCIKLKKGADHPIINTTDKVWQGRVHEVEDTYVDFEFDSISLKNLDQETLDYYYKNDEYPHIICVPYNEIEPAEARDKYEDVEQAQDELIQEIDLQDDNDVYEYMPVIRKWIRHFKRSELYFGLSKDDRDKSEFAIDVFADYMYNYEYLTPEEWDTPSMTSVCLHKIPSKVSDDKDFFVSFGEIMEKFFEFALRQNYIKDETLCKSIIEIKHKIVENSQDKSLWGPAKSVVMSAMDSGVDINNLDHIDAYLFEKQLEASSDIELEEALEEKPVENKFKNFGRNQKVTVKYINSDLVKEIKFKKVEQDLRDGICEIVEG